MAELNIIAKLSKAMCSVKGVEKDQTNDYQKYDYQSESAIKHAVKTALEKEGLVIIPKIEIINQYDRKSTKGNIKHFVDVMGTFVITDGHESYVGTMPGSGQDTGEKAVAKASTSAQKYFYKQLFNISDKDEDPDGDDSGTFKPNNQTKQKSKYAESEAIATFKQLTTDLATQKKIDIKGLYKTLFEQAKVKRKALKSLSESELTRLNKALDQLAAK